MNGKYCCGFQALCSKWVAAILFLFRSYLLPVPCYLKAQENNSSDEEREEVKTFEFDDFEPFMVLFR